MDLYNLIITLLTTGGIFSYIFFKDKKSQEAQKTRQEKNAADSGEFNNLKARVEFAEKSVNELTFKSNLQEKKLCGMQKYINKQSSQKRFAEYYICKKEGCAEREPELGTFKTEEFNEEKLEK